MCFRDVFLSLMLAMTVSACPPACTCTGVVLQCTGDHLTDIPVVSNATNMEVMNISHGSIPTLVDHVFSSYPGLTDVHLTFDAIAKIEPLAFRGLQSLVSLDLSHNRIKTLNPDVFEDCVVLKYLNVSYNPLASVFINVPSLTNLVLSACKLHGLPQSLFSGLPRLESLDVSSNNLTYLARRTFRTLHNLTHLEIGSNPWPCNDSTWTLVCWSGNFTMFKRPAYCYMGGSRHRLSSFFRDRTCPDDSSVIEEVKEQVTDYTHTPTEIFIASTLAVMIFVILLFFVGTRMAWFTNCCVPLRMFVYRSLRSDGY